MNCNSSFSVQKKDLLTSQHLFDIPMKWSVAFTLGNVYVILKSVLAVLRVMHSSCLLYFSLNLFSR